MMKCIPLHLTMPCLSVPLCYRFTTDYSPAFLSAPAAGGSGADPTPPSSLPATTIPPPETAMLTLLTCVHDMDSVLLSRWVFL